MASSTPTPPDYKEIATRLKEGMIVPFFGAGASRHCGLPSGGELAERLMAAGSFPGGERRRDLALAASYFTKGRDDIALKRELRAVLTKGEARPGSLHHCLADSKLGELRLYVTTNYDDLIEQALAHRAPWVVVDRGERGKVHCRPQGGEWQEAAPDDLRRTITDKARPIVLKLHGSLDRDDRANDHFLITEEQYVDFLGRSREALIPSMLYNTMKARSFLFLGYGLRDWNVRVLLRHLADSRGPASSIDSWAVVRHPAPAEQALWEMRKVKMLDIDLDEFVLRLQEHI
jgi:NAD-dependent SIR2 family protein deacetylase